MLILLSLIPIAILCLMHKSPFSRGTLRLWGNYLFLGAVLELLGSLGDAVRVPLMVMIVFLEASNIEHLINNNSNQHFGFVRFMFNPHFLKGSGLSKRFLIRLAVLQCAGVALYIWGPVPTLNLVLACLALGGAAFLIPEDFKEPSWSQESWHVFNLRNRHSKNEIIGKLSEKVFFSEKKIKQAQSEYEKIVPKDLGVGKWLPESKKKENVLVILVEGMSLHNLQDGHLPHLKKRIEGTIFSDKFICHQRNTNRGVYSLFTGHHPNLVSQIAESDLVAQYGKIDHALPEFLAQKGYHTVFLQGAHTRFMEKDRFLRKLGFNDVIGDEHYSKDIPRIRWGVDDKSLYSIAANTIEKMEQENKPWLLSILTVSTHHPFEASDRKLKNNAEAYLYADEMLEDFLKKLEASGVLDSTLVVITSDEASGESESFLSQNMGVLAILEPKKMAKKLSPIFCQADLAFSISDYLSYEEHPFVGRSFFRDYQNERPIYFANVFQQRAYRYSEEELLIKSYHGAYSALELPKLSLNEEMKAVELKPNSQKEFEAFIQCNDRDLSFLSEPVLVDIDEVKHTDSEKVEPISGSIKFGMQKGERLKLSFKAKVPASGKPIVIQWNLIDVDEKRSEKMRMILMPGTEQVYHKIVKAKKTAYYGTRLTILTSNQKDWEIKELQVSLLGN